MFKDKVTLPVPTTNEHCGKRNNWVAKRLRGSSLKKKGKKNSTGKGTPIEKQGICMDGSD